MISFSGKSEVFFAQVGGSVTLPYEGHTEKERHAGTENGFSESQRRAGLKPGPENEQC